MIHILWYYFAFDPDSWKAPFHLRRSALHVLQKCQGPHGHGGDPGAMFYSRRRLPPGGTRDAEGARHHAKVNFLHTFIFDTTHPWEEFYFLPPNTYSEGIQSATDIIAYSAYQRRSYRCFTSSAIACRVSTVLYYNSIALCTRCKQKSVRLTAST